MRHPQALSQQQLQSVAEPLAPMAQVRALVREGVLEKLLAGEELEIRVVDPALAHTFIGQPVYVLEQQQPDHETGLDPRPAVLAVERRDLAVDPVPIDLAGKQNQLVLQVDDLVQPRPEQIVRSRRLGFFGRIVPSDAHRNMVRRERESKSEIAGFGGFNLPFPAISNRLESEKETPAQSLRTLFTDD